MRIQVVTTQRIGKVTTLVVLPVAGERDPKSGAAANARSRKKAKPRAVVPSGTRRLLPVCQERIRELGATIGDPGALSSTVEAAIRLHKFMPNAGKRLELPLDLSTHFLRLSGVSAIAVTGADDQPILDEWRKLGGDAFQSAKRLRRERLSLDFTMVESKSLERIVRAAVEGIVLAEYEFTNFKGRKSAAPWSVSTVDIVVRNGRGVARKGVVNSIRAGEIAARAVTFARDLVNTPPSDMQPKDLAQAGRRIALRSKGRVRAKVFGASQLRRMGAGGILGVSRGSDVEPYLLHLTYRPRSRGKSSRRLIFIGKGITFDSGGLSIKTGKGMEDMKCDMAGAACVLSVIKAISELGRLAPCPHEVHVLVATCENMINGRSMKPGDVLRAMNGKTIEVLNTDAEGRLVLADALSYADRLKGDLIIDLATLTGACVVALGSDYAGLFSTSDAWAQVVRRFGSFAGEKSWPLPLADEYRPQLESDVADLRNIGTGGPGAILGALFLREFVPTNVPWIHLDIAGPAFGTKTNEYLKRGGTGYGVLTLLELLSEPNFPT